MTTDPTPTLYCANHPDRETMLRCNRCDKPICYQCAILTPVGYRCKECVRNQQAVYYNAAAYDLPIGIAVALVLGAVAGVLAYAFLGALGLFGFIAAFFAGPFVGGLIAEVIRRAVRRRRARYMKWAAAAACVVGVFLGGAILYGSRAGLIGWLPTVFIRWDVLLFTGLAASTIYARLL
jgi:uncharacterized membrane protein YeaQ/YmgE (transglycosylase-associated protein family)